LRAGLSASARVIYVWLSARRLAIWLLPVGCVGLAISPSMSLVAATAFAAIWLVGFAALLSELATRLGTPRRQP
jgi:hypothetical protein